MTAFLSNGTKGCGPICAVERTGILLALGDGDTEPTLTYGNSTAEMADMTEVDYGTL